MDVRKGLNRWNGSLALVVALTGLTAPAAAAPMPKLALLPLPASVTPGNGHLTVRSGAVVAAPADAKTAARLLIEHVAGAHGPALRNGDDAAAAIRFVQDASVSGAEAYRLTVDAHGVRIAASAPAGFVHGAMTLVQLLTPAGTAQTTVRLAAMDIRDAPKFPWRGLMIDPARHFQPIDSLFLIVDQMAAVKLNVLHLHLTDDQGWRFDVKRYPKLTEVGAWRMAPTTGGPAPTKPVGGFYTQDELRRLVAYAADRGITIVPEIDLPGHAQALVAAYPEMGVLGDRPVVSHDWGVNPYLLNPDAAGVAFVKNVLDELIDVFPGTYVHLGGDEAVKDQWERSPQVQAQMKKLGIATENGLQSWLIDEFGRYLASKGRRLIGWDEILEGGLPASASVMSWRGEKGAIDAANQNHDVVLAPAPVMYLDSLQSDRSDEPPGRLAIQTLADVYAFNPMPAGIDPAKAHHVLGAEATAFSEYLVTPWQVQHVVFPRIGALAENDWSAAPRDFPGFVARLQPQMARWRSAGVEVADSAFAVNYRMQGSTGDALRSNRLAVALDTQAPGSTIRYTLNGKAPTVRSPKYVRPLTLATGQTIRAAAFGIGGEPTAAVRDFASDRASLLRRTSSDMVSCPIGALGLRVPLTSEAGTRAPVFNVNLFDTCTAIKAAPLDVASGFTVDVVRLARHYGLAHDATAVRQHYNVTAHGELLVLVGCQAGRKGPPDKDAPKPIVAASFPLPDPETAPTQFAFTGTLPHMDGDRDVCFQFTSPTSDPFYTVAQVQMTERR
jgi:hexosaminidase